MTKPRLISIEPLESNVDGKRVVVDTTNGDFTIGRSSECRLTLDGGKSSRKHAMITGTEEGNVLYDMNSSNGTSVNRGNDNFAVTNEGTLKKSGHPNAPFIPAVLVHGDVLIFADACFMYFYKRLPCHYCREVFGDDIELDSDDAIFYRYRGGMDGLEEDRSDGVVMCSYTGRICQSCLVISDDKTISGSRFYPGMMERCVMYKNAK